MQLQRNIFLWVSLATVLPLTALVWGATSYSQYLYQQEVVRDVNVYLNHIVAGIERRLAFEREAVLGLSETPAVSDFLPVLKWAAQHKRHPEFSSRSDRLNRFLEAFQNTVPSLTTLRVLNRDGDTLVKVWRGQARAAVFESIDSFPYAEEELDDPVFVQRLQELPEGEVGFLRLPQSETDQDSQGVFLDYPLLDAVVPLSYQGKVVGYLAANGGGEAIDRILNLAPRLHKGTLLIAQLSPDESRHDGEVLYDETADIHFAGLRWQDVHLADQDGGRLWQMVQTDPYGALKSSDGGEMIYYMEYLPYPNRLVTWVVATRIGMTEITAPFVRIRRGIWLFAGVAVLITLLLTRLGTHKITRPISVMARSLKAYADGDRRVRVQAEGADEIRQLESAFNYMADTLARAEAERDHAQRMMLQSAKLASIGQMAAGIGHEINNPLNNILSLTKLIAREFGEDNETVRQDLNSLREEALRASRIVGGVLNFARQVPPAYSEFAIEPWLADSLQLVQREARRRGIRLEWRCDTGLTAEGDRGQLQQALINLILNAIQASPDNGLVMVTARREGNELSVTVDDQGPGLNGNIADRAFDPFFTTKPVGEGSGLGLSISLGIIEHHGGELSLRNRPEGGAQARICLPIQRREQTEAGEETSN